MSFEFFTGLPIVQLRQNVAQDNLFRYEEASVNWMPLGLSFCPSQWLRGGPILFSIWAVTGWCQLGLVGLDGQQGGKIKWIEPEGDVFKEDEVVLWQLGTHVALVRDGVALVRKNGTKLGL